MENEAKLRLKQSESEALFRQVLNHSRRANLAELVQAAHIGERKRRSVLHFQNGIRFQSR